jgi:hypothetical protein
MGPRAGLDAVEYGKVFHLSRESNPGLPARLKLETVNAAKYFYS